MWAIQGRVVLPAASNRRLYRLCLFFKWTVWIHFCSKHISVSHRILELACTWTASAVHSVPRTKFINQFLVWSSALLSTSLFLFSLGSALQLTRAVSPWPCRAARIKVTRGRLCDCRLRLDGISDSRTPCWDSEFLPSVIPWRVLACWDP